MESSSEFEKQKLKPQTAPKNTFNHKFKTSSKSIHKQVIIICNICPHTFTQKKRDLVRHIKAMHDNKFKILTQIQNLNPSRNSDK